MSRVAPPIAPLEAAIYAGLRKRIISLELKPGTMIFENALAKEFGVSRTPVRQALARLVREELLTVLPQRGAMISRLSAVKLREAQFVREALEMRAFLQLGRIWDVSGRHAPEHKQALALIERQRHAVAEHDYVQFVELDVAFHNTLVRALGNETLLAMLDSAYIHLTRLRYLELREARHEAESIADHVELLDLMAARLPERTADKLLHHLRHLETEREEMFLRHPELF